MQYTYIALNVTQEALEKVLPFNDSTWNRVDNVATLTNSSYKAYAIYNNVSSIRRYEIYNRGIIIIINLDTITEVMNVSVIVPDDKLLNFIDEANDFLLSLDNEFDLEFLCLSRDNGGL